MQEDEDVNEWSDAWAEFRRALAEGERESLDAVVSRSRRHLHGAGDGEDDDDDDAPGRDAGARSAGGRALGVAYAGLTAGERHELSGWNKRIAREEVFGRYYFPEHWELRELQTIMKFLELEDSNDSLDEALKFMSAPEKESTQRAIASIFFPGDYDPKSVLLKRGPILIDGAEERELLLFTHGFLLSRITFDTLMDILTSKRKGKALHEASFNSIDADGSGNIDRCELKEAFSRLNIPVGEHTIDSIMDRFDDDGDGQISSEEFALALQGVAPKNEKWGYLGTVGSKIKSSLAGTATGAEQKLACAYEYTEIDRIESVNACYSDANRVFATSSWAELVFTIHLKGGAAPLVLVCSKPEQRLAWVGALHSCSATSTQSKTSSELHSANERIAALEQLLEDQEEQATRDLVALDEQIKARLDDSYQRVAKCLERKDLEIQKWKRRATVETSAAAAEVLASEPNRKDAETQVSKRRSWF